MEVTSEWKDEDVMKPAAFFHLNAIPVQGWSMQTNDILDKNNIVCLLHFNSFTILQQQMPKSNNSGQRRPLSFFQGRSIIPSSSDDTINSFSMVDNPTNSSKTQQQWSFFLSLYNRVA
jgi:hypothetical protein